MVKKSRSPEQIITKLREVEILLNQGTTVSGASRKIGAPNRPTTGDSCLRLNADEGY